LNRLWGSGPQDLWAVGDGGTILHFDGAGWARARSGTTDTLVAISGRGRGDAWAAGRGRTLLRLRDKDWQPVLAAADGGAASRPPAAGEFHDLVALSNGEAWVVGGAERNAAGGDEPAGVCILGRLDARGWLFDQDDACGPLVQVWGRSPDDVWARGGGDVIHWDGRTLTKNPPGKPTPLVGRHGAADGWRLQIDWGSGTAGTLSHETRAPRVERAPRARDFWAFGDADVWTIGGDGALAHFDGAAWQSGDAPLRIEDVAARAADDLWAVASPATLLHYDGQAWRASPIPGAGTTDRVAIAAPGPNDIWVLAGNKILRFDGARWSEPPGITQAGRRTWSALLALSPNDVWIGAERLALHWNGRSLDAYETDFSVTPLWGGAGEVWAGSPARRWTGEAFVIPTALPGETSTPSSRPDSRPTSTPTWAGAASPGAVWLARGGSIQRLAAGRLTVVGTLPVSLRAIWQSPSGDVWAAGSHLVHGVADAAGAMTWTIEDSVGLTDMTKVGGTRDLVWVRGAEGLLIRATP
jgi:hypothetical protein